MKKAIVTGCAGFIGSHLTEALLKKDYFVIGIDCFTDYYPRKIKYNNLSNFVDNPRFMLIQKDVSEITSETPVFKTLNEIDTIYHLAAQAGVRASWGDDFRKYTLNTFESTQRILELAKQINPRQVIIASSSSVYGNELEMPLSDSWSKDLWPISPYGVTKLAAEKLCYLYNKSFNLNIACLRYFSVFGPRQRPDLAFSKWISQILKDEELLVYGNGTDMTRDYTYISDIIEATIRIAEKGVNFDIFNVGGGGKNRFNALEAIKIIEEILNKKAKKKFLPSPPGDIKHNYSSIDKLKKLIDFEPNTNLKAGLQKQIEWYLKNNN